MGAVIGAEVFERRRRARSRQERLFGWLSTTDASAVRTGEVVLARAAGASRITALPAGWRVGSQRTAGRRLRDAIALGARGGRRPIVAMIAVEAAQRVDAELAMAFVDAACRGRLRYDDWIAPWHGGSVLLVMYDRLDRCLATLEHACAALGAAFPGMLGAAAGLALVRPDDRLDDVLHRSRRALARAQQRGGGAEISVPD